MPTQKERLVSMDGIVFPNTLDGPERERVLNFDPLCPQERAAVECFIRGYRFLTYRTRRLSYDSQYRLRYCEHHCLLIDTDGSLLLYPRALSLPVAVFLAEFLRDDDMNPSSYVERYKVARDRERDRNVFVIYGQEYRQLPFTRPLKPIPILGPIMMAAFRSGYTP